MAGPENPIVKLVRAVLTTVEYIKNFAFGLAGNRTEFGLKSSLTALARYPNFVLCKQ